MSSPEAQLKRQIAEILHVSPDAITPDTSLDLPRFRSSAGTMILQSVVRSATGRAAVTAGVRTFGELMARVSGEPASNGAPSAAAAVPAAIGPGVNGAVGQGMTGCGVDIEDVAAMPASGDFWAHEFYTANFSPEEIAYCVGQADPRPHFAARWCAKEALKKAAAIYFPLAPSDIQVVRHPAGNVSLQVRSAGQWHDAPAAVSLSHSEHSAVGLVILQSPAAPTPMPPATNRVAPSAGVAPPAAVGTVGKSWLRRLRGG